jgi:hypothetical protein
VPANGDLRNLLFTGTDAATQLKLVSLRACVRFGLLMADRDWQDELRNAEHALHAATDKHHHLRQAFSACKHAVGTLDASVSILPGDTNFYSMTVCRPKGKRRIIMFGKRRPLTHRYKKRPMKTYPLDLLVLKTPKLYDISPLWSTFMEFDFGSTGC